MLKKTPIAFTLSLLVLLGITVAMPLWGVSAQPSSKTAHSAVATDASTGTLQKMIVENGSVTMNLDLNGLNGLSSAAQNLQELHFAVAANSFFPVLVFKDQLRGPMPGSMALIPVEAAVPAAGSSVSQATRLPLQSLVIEKLASGQGFDLAVRDSNTGFTFFNIQGHQTITTPLRNRLPSRMAGCSSQKSLPMRWAVPRTLVHRLEQSPLGRRCSRSKSRSLLTGNRNQSSCRPCNTRSARERQPLCQGRMSSLGTSKTWINREAPEHRLVWPSEQTLVTTATSQSIGSRYLKPITRWFRKIFIG